MFDNCGGCDCANQFEVKFGNITGLGVGPLARKNNAQGRPHASAAAGSSQTKADKMKAHPMFEEVKAAIMGGKAPQEVRCIPR